MVQALEEDDVPASGETALTGETLVEHNAGEVAADGPPEEPGRTAIEPDPEGPGYPPFASALEELGHAPSAPALEEPERIPTVPPPSPRRESNAAKPPLLASEALMEDLAPFEPAREAARYWCSGLGLGAVVLGSLSALGLRDGGLHAAVPSFMLGLVALVAALARVSYHRRAVAMVVLGAVSAAMGLGGAGPALGIEVGGFGWSVLRIVAASTLPAALFFRARYRAYAGARWILGVAFAAAIPFVIYALMRLVELEFGLGPLGSLLALLAITASLTGFMGSETTGAASYMALGVIVGLSLELALQALSVPESLSSMQRIADVGVATLGFAGTSVMIALGLFQILSWRLCADARRIDLHAPPPREKAPSSESIDWSTRG